MSVEDCVNLIEGTLGQEYSTLDNHASTIVHSTPDLVLQNSTVQLWAQSLDEESITVNMLMPGIKAFLKGLATYGVGYADEYRGVRYKFVQSKPRQDPKIVKRRGLLTRSPQANLNSGTTTPIQSL